MLRHQQNVGLALFVITITLLIQCQEPHRAPEATQPPPQRTAASQDSEAVTSLVRQFGTKLQLVSLLAPQVDLERSMRQHYATFVTSALLQRWIANPASAAGRRVSSPWPDRIEVVKVTPEGPDRYVVDAEVVEVTSDRSERRIPARLIVERSGDGWRIADWQSRDEESPISEPDGSVDAAVSVIRSYYEAINERDYERAYRYWSGEGQASGKSLPAFKNGFAQTASVDVKIGTPGRIEPAAGSRYIEIPVEVTAKTSSEEMQRFRGKYVLRRSVVDGATSEQRQWRIESAKLSRVAAAIKPPREAIARQVRFHPRAARA